MNSREEAMKKEVLFLIVLVVGVIGYFLIT
jgi:hypothetical protein